VSSEASSIAGTQELGNLTVIYDDNNISIEDNTDVAFNEDVTQRYEAYGWHVQTVDWTHGGSDYAEDVQALYDALVAAEEVTDRPSFIRLRTIIAWPAPKAQNTGKAHGSALGEEEVAATKKVLCTSGWRRAACPTAGPTRCPRSPPTPRGWPPARPPAR
jgi:transketolase